MKLKNNSDFAKSTEKPDGKKTSKGDKNGGDTKNKYKKLGAIFAVVLVLSIGIIVLALIPCKTGFRIVQF